MVILLYYEYSLKNLVTALPTVTLGVPNIKYSHMVLWKRGRDLT